MDEKLVLSLNRKLVLAIKELRQFKCGEFTVDLQIAHYTTNSCGHYTQLHHHEYYELAYVPEGTMEYRIGHGAKVVNFMKADNPRWQLIPAKIMHLRGVISAEATVFAIVFRIASAKTDLLARFNQILCEKAYLLENGQSLKWLRLIDHELEHDLALRAEFLGNIMEMIVLELFRASFAKFFLPNESLSSNELMPEMIAAYIDEHLNSDLTLASLAARYRVSPRHLNRIFSSHRGIPLGQYIIRQRLKLCAHQLLNTDKQIKEIASDCGFKHQGYFIRQFLKHFNFLPSEYRQHG
jgi:AraC-like DNA-binding protein